MRESEFQKRVIGRLRLIFPGCLILKNDANYLQGIPDWTILWNGHWAVVEMKDSETARHQPNQDYYVEKLNKIGFSMFVYPENEEEFFYDIQQAFRS